MVEAYKSCLGLAVATQAWTSMVEAYRGFQGLPEATEAKAIVTVEPYWHYLRGN